MLLDLKDWASAGHFELDAEKNSGNTESNSYLMIFNLQFCIRLPCSTISYVRRVRCLRMGNRNVSSRARLSSSTTEQGPLGCGQWLTAASSIPPGPEGTRH